MWGHSVSFARASHLNNMYVAARIFRDKPWKRAVKRNQLPVAPYRGRQQDRIGDLSVSLKSSNDGLRQKLRNRRIHGPEGMLAQLLEPHQQSN